MFHIRSMVEGIPAAFVVDGGGVVAWQVCVRAKRFHGLLEP